MIALRVTDYWAKHLLLGTKESYEKVNELGCIGPTRHSREMMSIFSPTAGRAGRV
jgi:hypothetical protein